MRNVLIFDFLLVSLYQVVTARFFLNNCGSACWHIYCFITLPVPGEKWNLSPLSLSLSPPTPPLSLSLPPLPPSADSNKADAAQTYIYRHNGTRRTIFFWTHSEVCIKKWLRYWGMHQLLLTKSLDLNFWSSIHCEPSGNCPHERPFVRTCKVCNQCRQQQQQEASLSSKVNSYANWRKANLHKETKRN